MEYLITAACKNGYALISIIYNNIIGNAAMNTILHVSSEIVQ